MTTTMYVVKLLHLIKITRILNKKHFLFKQVWYSREYGEKVSGEILKADVVLNQNRKEKKAEVEAMELPPPDLPKMGISGPTISARSAMSSLSRVDQNQIASSQLLSLTAAGIKYFRRWHKSSEAEG